MKIKKVAILSVLVISIVGAAVTSALAQGKITTSNNKKGDSVFQNMFYVSNLTRIDPYKVVCGQTNPSSNQINPKITQLNPYRTELLIKLAKSVINLNQVRIDSITQQMVGLVARFANRPELLKIYTNFNSTVETTLNNRAKQDSASLKDYRNKLNTLNTDRQNTIAQAFSTYNKTICTNSKLSLNQEKSFWQIYQKTLFSARLTQNKARIQAKNDLKIALDTNRKAFQTTVTNALNIKAQALSDYAIKNTTHAQNTKQPTNTTVNNPPNNIIIDTTSTNNVTTNPIVTSVSTGSVTTTSP